MLSSDNSEVEILPFSKEEIKRINESLTDHVELSNFEWENRRRKCQVLLEIILD